MQIDIDLVPPRQVQRVLQQLAYHTCRRYRMLYREIQRRFKRSDEDENRKKVRPVEDESHRISALLPTAAHEHSKVRLNTGEEPAYENRRGNNRRGQEPASSRRIRAVPAY